MPSLSRSHLSSVGKSLRSAPYGWPPGDVQTFESNNCPAGNDDRRSRTTDLRVDFFCLFGDRHCAILFARCRCEGEGEGGVATCREGRAFDPHIHLLLVAPFASSFSLSFTTWYRSNNIKGRREKNEGITAGEFPYLRLLPDDRCCACGHAHHMVRDKTAFDDDSSNDERHSAVAPAHSLDLLATGEGYLQVRPILNKEALEASKTTESTSWVVWLHIVVARGSSRCYKYGQWPPGAFCHLCECDGP